MTPRERSYHCKVCGWRGTAEPLDFADAAPCPNCGAYAYPQSWAQTWGVALLLVAASLGFVFAAVALLK